MVSSFTPDFSVTWQEPADAQQSWLFDPMHMPAPVCQLGGEFWDRMFTKYMSARTVFVNGYGFSTPPIPPAPTRESCRAACSTFGRTTTCHRSRRRAIGSVQATTTA